MTTDEILKKATPRPWRSGIDNANEIVSTGESEVWIASANSHAARCLILRAVNSYEADQALIATLTEALEKTKVLWDKYGLGDSDRECEPVYAKVVAALAAAKKARE